MAAITATFTSVRRGLLLKMSSYHETAVRDLAQLPGLVRDPMMGGYWAPPDLVMPLRDLLSTRAAVSGLPSAATPPLGSGDATRERLRSSRNDVCKALEFLLRNYQAEAISWLLGVNSGILALDMGLGKGLTSIVAAVMGGPGPYLIVCPAGLVRQVWAGDETRGGEIAKWLGIVDVRVCGSGRERAEDWGLGSYHYRRVPNFEVLDGLTPDSWVVCSYELLDCHSDRAAPDSEDNDDRNGNGTDDGVCSQRRKSRTKWSEIDVGDLTKPLPGESPWLSKLGALPFSTVILDEIQYIKKRTRGRSVGIRRLGRMLSKARKIGLTGTPIHNRVQDLWAVLDFVAPGRFGSYWPFAIRYCNAQETAQGWIETGTSNESELSHRLQWVLFRRTKQEVAKSLPPKIRRVERVIDPESVEAIRSATLESIVSTGHKPSRERLRAMLHRLGGRKIHACVDLLEQSCERSVVFTFMRETAEDLSIVAADALSADNRDVWKMDGATRPAERARMLDEWRVSTNGVLVATMDTAGTGIDLSAGSLACFVDFDYVPGDMLQAEDRLWRPPQNSVVSVVYFAVADSPDEEIASLVIEKLDQHMTIMGREGAQSGLRQDLVVLLSGDSVLMALRDRLLAAGD